MKKIVVYKSVLGTTKEYSEWISEEVGADTFQWYQINRNDLTYYDLVVVASGPYGCWEPLADYLEKSWNILKDKEVIIVCVGKVPSTEGKKCEPKDKVKRQIWEKVKYFALPGRLNPETADLVSKDRVVPIIEYIREVEGRSV